MSELPVCFLMIISFVVASLPPMQRKPSELVNQRNFSYHFLSLVRAAAAFLCPASPSALLLAASRSSISWLSFCLVLSRAVFAPSSFFFAFFAFSKYTAALPSTDLRISSVIVGISRLRQGRLWLLSLQVCFAPVLLS